MRVLLFALIGLIGFSVTACVDVDDDDGLPDTVVVDEPDVVVPDAPDVDVTVEDDDDDTVVIP